MCHRAYISHILHYVAINMINTTHERFKFNSTFGADSDFGCFLHPNNIMGTPSENVPINWVQTFDENIRTTAKFNGDRFRLQGMPCLWYPFKPGPLKSSNARRPVWMIATGGDRPEAD